MANTVRIKINLRKVKPIVIVCVQPTLRYFAPEY